MPTPKFQHYVEFERYDPVKHGGPFTTQAVFRHVGIAMMKKRRLLFVDRNDDTVVCDITELIEKMSRIPEPGKGTNETGDRIAAEMEQQRLRRIERSRDNE